MLCSTPFPMKNFGRSLCRRREKSKTSQNGSLVVATGLYSKIWRAFFGALAFLCVIMAAILSHGSRAAIPKKSGATWARSISWARGIRARRPARPFTAWLLPNRWGLACRVFLRKKCLRCRSPWGLAVIWHSSALPRIPISQKWSRNGSKNSRTRCSVRSTRTALTKLPMRCSSTWNKGAKILSAVNGHILVQIALCLNFVAMPTMGAENEVRL